MPNEAEGPGEVRSSATTLAALGDAGLRRVIDSTVDHAIVATDAEGRITLWSEGARRLFGWEAAEVLGRLCDLMFTPEDRAAAVPAREVEAALAAGRATDERWLVKRDGSRFWGNGWAAPLRDMGDEAVGLVKVLRDATAERVAVERLRLAYEVAGACAWEFDPATGLSIWDPAAQRVLGLPAPVLPAEDAWAAFVHPDDLGRVRAGVGDALDPAGGGRYEAEHRVIGLAAKEAGGAPRWFQSLGQAWFEGEGAARRAVRLVCVSTDVTARHKAEERRRLLVNELNHRVKNTLATVQSLARQTGRGAVSAPEFLSAFETRLLALARAHDLLTREDWTGATVGEVARGALAPHLADGRVRLAGPSLRVEPRAAVALAMALQELATNAAKHGALSAGGGSVAASWRADGGGGGASGGLLEWEEAGGPPVAQPMPGAKRGFGMRLLLQGLRQDLGAGADLRFEPGGLRCAIRFPLGA